MRPSLRPLAEQTLVVTGASSGIGLVTARLAASRGARVVLVARDAHDLECGVADIRLAGGQAMAVVADVGDFDAVQRAAERAVAAFGAIDSWVNTAGARIHGQLRDVPLADARRLFDTNYWGVVHGSLVAVPHLARHGGALISAGGVLSDTTMPLRGHGAVSQHAVRGFTDALRREVEEAGLPVAVTLVEPAAIDTAGPQRVGNDRDIERRPQPPVYAPELVAEAILACAVPPTRDATVAGSAPRHTAIDPETVAPRLLDRDTLAGALAAQRADAPAHETGTHHAPRADDRPARGGGREQSPFTMAALHPMATVLGVAALGAGAALARRLRER